MQKNWPDCLDFSKQSAFLLMPILIFVSVKQVFYGVFHLAEKPFAFFIFFVSFFFFFSFIYFDFGFFWFRGFCFKSSAQLLQQIPLLGGQIFWRYNLNGNILVAFAVAFDILTPLPSCELSAALHTGRNGQSYFALQCLHLHVGAQGAWAS